MRAAKLLAVLAIAALGIGSFSAVALAAKKKKTAVIFFNQSPKISKSGKVNAKGSLNTVSACEPSRSMRLQVLDTNGVVLTTLDGSTSDPSGRYELCAGEGEEADRREVRLPGGSLAECSDSGYVASWRSIEIGAPRRGIRLDELRDQRRPAELAGTEALAGVRLVELAQPFPGDRSGEALGHLERLRLVSTSQQADPDQPGGVDPGRAAPVQAPQRPPPPPRLEAGLLGRDRGTCAGRAGAPRPGACRSPRAGPVGPGGRARTRWTPGCGGRPPSGRCHRAWRPHRGRCRERARGARPRDGRPGRG